MLLEKEFYKFLEDNGEDPDLMCSVDLDLLKACWKMAIKEYVIHLKRLKML